MIYSDAFCPPKGPVEKMISCLINALLLLRYLTTVDELSNWAMVIGCTCGKDNSISLNNLSLPVLLNLWCSFEISMSTYHRCVWGILLWVHVAGSCPAFQPLTSPSPPWGCSQYILHPAYICAWDCPDAGAGPCTRPDWTSWGSSQRRK